MKHKNLFTISFLIILITMACDFSDTGGGLVLLFAFSGCVLFVMLYGSKRD